MELSETGLQSKEKIQKILIVYSREKHLPSIFFVSLHYPKYM